MTVKELIVWLEGQDQDAVVQVIKHSTGMDHYDQGGSIEEVDFDPDPNQDTFEYTDFRGNKQVKPTEPYFDKRYLLLGSTWN